MSWPTVKLSEVAPHAPLKIAKASSDKLVLQLTLDHIESNSGVLLTKNYQPISAAGSSTHWFDDRYVLYSKLRPYLNKVYLPEEIGLGTTELVPMLPDRDRLDRNYLAYYLRSKAFVDWVSAQTAGAKMPRVSMKVFWDHAIPLPPLETQKKIAAILEKADQLRKDCQQMEQELNNLAQSVFMDMFGDPVSNPKGWELRPCAAICEDITVGVVVRPASYYAISGVPALRSLNVRENKLSDENLVYFSEEANEKKVPKSRIYEGNVLIVRSGQPGRAAVVTKKYDGCNCIDVLIARPDKTVIEPHFLSFFLNSEGGRRLVLKEERGQIQKHLNVKALNEALIPVPDIKHQNKFVAFLVENQLRLDECKANLAELEELYSSLVKKAFNGELKIKAKAA